MNEKTPKYYKECPYFPDLLENQQLRHELNRERQKREAAEMHSGLISKLSGFISTLFLCGIVVFVMCSSSKCEDPQAYVDLIQGYSLLFFSLSVLLVTVRLLLHYFSNRKCKKDGEDGNV